MLEWIADARRYPKVILREQLEPKILMTREETNERLLAAYQGLGLLEEDIKLSRSSLWHRRIVAVRRLAMVRKIAPRDVLIERAEDSHSIRILSAVALSEVGTADDIFRVIGKMDLPLRLMERPIFHMLNQMRADKFEDLLARWDELPSVQMKKVLLISAAGHAPAKAFEIYTKALVSSSSEVRLGAAVSASRMPGAKLVEGLLQLIQDEKFQVRAQAARSMGVFNEPLFIDALAKALGDPSFWVRQNAATSLAYSGDVGIERLKQVSKTSEDVFAKEAAEEEIELLSFLSSAKGGAA
jgi:HEAT repeats